MPCAPTIIVYDVINLYAWSGPGPGSLACTTSTTARSIRMHGEPYGTRVIVGEHHTSFVFTVGSSSPVMVGDLDLCRYSTATALCGTPPPLHCEVSGVS